MKDLILTPFDQVIATIARGEMVILVDDASREDEGDLVIATDKLTPEAVNFMAQYGRGLICVSIPESRATELNVPLQTLSNRSSFGPAFTVSIDHRAVLGRGATSTSRTLTMRALVDPTSTELDFVSPGQVFPLIAHRAGVLGRQGQTEGSLELARIAGLTPSGVVCEILDRDGNLLRGKDLMQFATQHKLPITSVAEIISYRVHHEVLVQEVAREQMETEHGFFETVVFEDMVAGKEHLALLKVIPGSQHAPLVRIHSECLTGDVFGSKRCDCGEQLSSAMKMIEREGGIVLYLPQEGRGIGLGNKLRAYALQDQGHDTFDANVQLGFAADERDYIVAAKILQQLGAQTIRLLTNNPEKLSGLEHSGITIAARVPLVVPETPDSSAYIKTKRDRFGHLL